MSANVPRVGDVTAATRIRKAAGMCEVPNLLFNVKLILFKLNPSLILHMALSERLTAC